MADDPIIREMQAERAFGSMYGTTTVDPLKAAHANETARKLGMSPELVEAAFPAAQAEELLRRRREETLKNQAYARMMANNPRLAASSAHDDKLPVVAQRVDDHVKMFDFSSLPDLPIGSEGGMFGNATKLVVNATEKGMAGVGIGIGRFLSGTAQVLQGAVGLGTAAGENIPIPLAVDPISGLMSNLRATGRPIGRFLDRISKAAHYEVKNRTVNDMLSGVESLPGSLAALGVTALTRSPTAGAAALGAVTGGQSYLTGRDENLTPREALLYGLGDAVVETGTELAPEHFIGRALSVLPGGKGFVREALQAAGTEVGGEVLATGLQSLNRWYWIDQRKGQTFDQFMATLPDQEQSTVVSTLTTLGLTLGAGHIARKAYEPLVDRRAANNVDRIMETAAGSETRKINPSDFREALNQLVGDTAVEHVYVPAQAIVDSLPEGQQLSEHPIWGKHAAQISEAQQLGGDVVLPLADVATDMAGTPEWEAIRDQVRTRPGGASVKEISDRQTPEQLQAAAGEVASALNTHINNARLMQARQIVGNWSQQLGYSGDRANVVNRMLASALSTRYNDEQSRRIAAGEPAQTLEDFAKDWMPQAVRMRQAEYEKGGHPTFESTGAFSEEGTQVGRGVEADAEPVRQPAGVRGGLGLLDESPGSVIGNDEPLAGAPRHLNVPGRGLVEVRPTRTAREAATRFMQTQGLTYLPTAAYAKLDEPRAKRIAAEFEAMKHDPNDPTVKAAYEAMIKETLEQFQAIKQTGLEIEFITGEDPYAATPRLAILDVQENNHLWVFPTEGGFGQGEVTDSPLLQPVDEFIGGSQLLANDVFRIVHDYFGHIKDGHGFRAEGEENAWQSHAAMFSPLARRAMTTETRGQNSWLNFGPYAEHNKNASAAETIYAPQKVGLMPEWTSEEGMLADPSSGTPVTLELNQRAGRAVREEEQPRLVRPPTDAEGNVVLDHFGIEPGIVETDPSLWGRSGRFLPSEERNRIGVAPGRTYFGIATGQPGGYRREFGGVMAEIEGPRYGYRAAIPLDKLYDMAGDPLGLKEKGRAIPKNALGRYQHGDNLNGMDGVSLYEQLIKDAGYAGYWINDPSVGMVAAVFDPLQLRPVAQTLNQAVEVPGFGYVSPYLTGDELAKLRDDSKRKIMKIVSTLPKAEEMAAVAVAGRAKKGWYARSAQAIVDVFGIADAPRFAALLAALSPQTSVEMNMTNAVRIWVGWNQEGRPTDRAGIDGVLNKYIWGGKETSVLPAWRGNAFAALSDRDPASLNLSGPKVNSFFANLVGVVDEVTNDTWMANYADVDPVMFKKTGQNKGPGYKAMNAAVRKAAEIATEKTGESWSPSEIQEAIWSFARTLYLRRDTAEEDRTMQELLDAGEITHADIADTPDFAVLFGDGMIRAILEEGGYDPSTVESAGRADGRAAESGSVAAAQGTGFDEADFRDFLAQAAERLERVRNRRRSDRAANDEQLTFTLNQAVTPAEEVFYSAAQRAVANAPQEKASAQQWKALLTPGKTPGIKSEEIEWTGIHDWLDMQQGQIQKAALLQVLRDRGIQVEEVVLGRTDKEKLADYGLTDADLDLEENEDAPLIVAEGNAQFQNWSSDPSNPTYRELLITLPMGVGSNPERAPSTHWDTEGVVAHMRFMDKTDADGKRVLFIEEVQSDWHQKGRDQGYANPAPQAEIDDAQKNADQTYEAYKEARRLMIDEAVRVGLMERGDLTDEQNEGTAASKIHGFIQSTADEGDQALKLYQAYRAVQLASNEANQILQNAKGGTGIPEAPFKSSWPALVMKRAIRWAVDHGYDKVAWTTGEEQASRYNLGQSIGEIGVDPTDEEDGRVMIHFASNPDLAQTIGEQLKINMRGLDYGFLDMTPEQAKEVFGNDIGKRIIEISTQPANARTLDLNNASVGGEGMKAFYDRNLVNITNDIVKKYGAKVKPLPVKGMGGTDAAINEARNRWRSIFTEARAALGPPESPSGMWGTAEIDVRLERLSPESVDAEIEKERAAIKNNEEAIQKGPEDWVEDKSGWLASMEKMTNKRRDRLAALGKAIAPGGSFDERRAELKDWRGKLEEAERLMNEKPDIPGSNFGFEITDKLREAASSGFTLFQPKRGNISIEPGEDGLMRSALIRAFEASDFSTAVHELGHFFLEDLRRRALSTGATQQSRADWETFKVWAAEIGHDVTDDGPIPVDAHEYFARGFERFTWEGQSPSVGLRAVFFKMRQFMLDLYKRATQFNAPITPEIRDVMGRMVASDAEIEEQRKEMALVSGKVEELMSEQERAQYRDLGEESRQDARDILFNRVLSSLRQEKLAEARERKEQIRGEVQTEVETQPISRALRLLKVGMPLPDGRYARVKLNAQQLTEAYGDDVLGTMPRTVPPIVGTGDNTLDVDQVAAMTGFDSGDQLVKALQSHAADQTALKESGDRRGPQRKQVDDRVDARVRDEIGDPLADLEEEARAALANERQADRLSMELRAIARKTGRKPTAWRIAREWAANRVRQATSQEAISGRTIQLYSRNAAKAAREAEEAIIAGKMDDAFTAKQRQMLNTALLSEARKVKEEVEKVVRRMRKVSTSDRIPSVDPDYLEQAHQLLEDVELKEKSQTKVAEREAFEDWYLKRVAEGVEPSVPSRFRTMLGQRHWTRLTIDELLELDTAVGQIVELGRLKKRLRDGQRARDFDEGIMEQVGQAETTRERSKSKTTDPQRTFGGRVKSRLRGFDAAMIKVEQMVEWLDGGEINGPWRRMLFAPLAEAQVREKDLTSAYVQQLNGLIKALPQAQVRSMDREVDTPELIIRNPGHSQAGEPFRGTKDQIVVMAMNWGNEGNRQRLLEGFGWQAAQLDAVFNRLMTKDDWNFVQGVWDMVDQLWPEIEALERRVNGVAPEKVERIDVPTRHGIYRGGYFPVVYDPNESTRAELDEANKLAPNGAWHQVTTRAGATKGRVDVVKNRPILLNMGVITRHLGEVIHDITHREAIVQARKIISDNRIRAVINSRLGPEYYKRFGSWVENIATPNISNSKSDPTMIAIARHLNKGVSLVGLGFRFTAAASQLIGFSNTKQEVKRSLLLEALRIVQANPQKVYNEVVSRSGEMRSRFGTMDATIEDMMNEAGKGKLRTIGPKAFLKYAFHGMLYMDMVVTTVSWTAAFNQALKQGESEDDAVAYADSVVRKTQGAGGRKDRSAILYENEFARSFWPFFSYLNALYNQQRDVFHRARRAESASDYLDVARRAWWVMVVPAVLQAFMFGDGPPDDENDAEGWSKWIAKAVALGNFASIPGVGPIANALGSGYGYRSNAWQGIGENIKKSWDDIDKLRRGETDEPKGSTVQSVVQTAGIVTAKPLGQIGATGRGLYDYARGEADPQGVGDWYQLLTKGRIPTKPTALEQAKAKVEGQ
jgi:hypothetical protein